MQTSSPPPTRNGFYILCVPSGASLIAQGVRRPHSPVVVRDEVDGDTEVTVAAGSPDAVQVRLGVLREVKVDHHVHRLDVYTPRKQVCSESNTSV